MSHKITDVSWMAKRNLKVSLTNEIHHYYFIFIHFLRGDKMWHRDEGYGRRWREVGWKKLKHAKLKELRDRQ